MKLKYILSIQAFLHILSIITAIILGQYAVDKKTAIIVLMLVDILAFWTITIVFEYKYNTEERGLL